MVSRSRCKNTRFWTAVWNDKIFEAHGSKYLTHIFSMKVIWDLDLLNLFCKLWQQSDRTSYCFLSLQKRTKRQGKVEPKTRKPVELTDTAHNSCSVFIMNEPAEPQIKDIEASVPSDEERDLAANALSEFQKGAYALCLTYLNRLEALRPKDVKVMHNKVVAEYYKSDLKKTELVKKSLNAMCGELISTDTADAADVVEKCVMRYNQAILLYHTRQYNAALQIMSRLFSLIEPLVSEESLAQKVCLLLIELYIATAQSDAALTLVNYIERQFSVSDLPKISSTDKEGLIKPAREEKEIKTDSSDIATDAFRMRLAKCKIRIYLITHQLKLCKKEWKAFTSMGTNMNLANIYLAANVEYLRGKCKKAITLLNAFTTEQREFKAYGESAAVLYYNNMASIHQALGKPNLACFYLQKALEQNKKATENLQIDEKAGQHAVRFSQITAIETLNLKISILADSAYVSLCLGEYSIALEYAKSLLALNNLPGAYTMLGKLYTAESLIFLDKINEALDYLRPEMLTDLITSLPIPDTLDKDKEKSEEIDRKPIKVWYPTNILTGKAVLLYNMAVAYAIRGQLDRSGEIVGQLWKSKGTDYDIPIHVIMLALYIELQLGRTDKWRSIIKRNYPQYF
ncbi:CCR4-NOT transcription complex subunit 10 isoform X3 [Belonocnema kinseyi]|uniref:CCR4-NOT transcription complex subunit 10 isoform X3 n=1 Tax=Belonocnema kinseyi TaxID=2817044 RepID=UPI00143DC7DC|nr:CCR4-NOT transcription complex subunit 10 isoform X3 [Belonocnema kinseyi]